MKVFLLTEGGSNLGFGHLTRCTSIYETFVEIGILPQFIVNGDETATMLLKGKNCKVFDWLDDRDRLLAAVRGADIVFIDSYLADYGLYEKISQLVETVVYFDDDLRVEYPRGVVVNGAVLAEQMPYPKRKDVTYLLGTQYTPLRKEFWNVPAKPISDNLKTVMIIFGGTDMHNITPKVLKLLSDTQPAIIKKVIIGSSFQNATEIEKLRDNNTELIHYASAAEMKSVMLESDIAISGCGQTLYELARVGLPVIGICIAQNQLQNIEGWRKSGFLEHVGWYNSENLLKKATDAINKLIPYEERFRRSTIGRSYIDGKGVERIMGELIKNIN